MGLFLTRWKCANCGLHKTQKSKPGVMGCLRGLLGMHDWIEL